MNWEQLRAILWLRWRLTKNQFRRAGRLNAVVSVLLVAVLLLAGTGCGLGGFALGAVLGAKASPPTLLLVWDVAIFLFLVFWLGGVVVEIQRAESVDLTKLFHLPVTLQQVFVFNYVISHFTPSLVILVPGLLGMSLGLTRHGGPALGLTVPLVIGFLFLVTAWTYCLRGWLAAMMLNKRRWRTLLIGLVFTVVLLAQLPVFLLRAQLTKPPADFDPYVQSDPTAQPVAEPVWPAFFLQAHLVLPVGWPGYGAMELKQGRSTTALVLTAAGFVIGALGLARAYRSAIRFYRGTEKLSERKQLARPERKGRTALLIEQRLPGLADDTAALALATFRSLTRAPEMKMALIMPVMLCTMLVMLQITGLKSVLTEMGGSLVATAILGSAAFSLAPVMSNVFGLDRNGFRALVLLPTSRRAILLAKNLAFFPFLLLLTLLILALAKWLAQLSWATVLAGLVQVPAAFFLFAPVCNWTSIRMPHRIAERSLKAKKTNAITYLAGLAAMLFVPFVLLPLLIPAGLQTLFADLGWLPGLPVNLLAGLALLGGTAWLYRCALHTQARMLEQHEQTILREVTEEVE